MKRALLILVPAVLGASFVGAVYAQTKAPDAKCGPEVWSSEKMTYVSVPCTGGQEATPAPGNQTAKAPGSAPCGVETFSSASMTYVTEPCPAGLTYENPGYKEK